jgi:DNA (cytosine-5)-methyltransferase 1
MNELALFAGAGGGILGGHLLGWRTVCAVEWEAYPASVLVARQNDKILPTFPIWDDVQTFDGKPWRGIVDVVSGGFPCQDISAAGNGAGITGARSSMWGHMARIIGEVRPKYAFVENSPMLTSRGLGTVLRDLATMGYDAEWCVLGADDVGANHHRKRIWILAYFNSRLEQTWSNSRILEQSNSQRQTIGHAHGSSQENVGDSKGTRFSSCELGQRKIESWRTSSRNSQWWASEPNVDRVVDGLASRVDRLKAIGNGQVPLCAATAWNILKGRIDDKS